MAEVSMLPQQGTVAGQGSSRCNMHCKALCRTYSLIELSSHWNTEVCTRRFGGGSWCVCQGDKCSSRGVCTGF